MTELVDRIVDSIEREWITDFSGERFTDAVEIFSTISAANTASPIAQQCEHDIISYIDQMFPGHSLLMVVLCDCHQVLHQVLCTHRL